jgi:hypothetical protein
MPVALAAAFFYLQDVTGTAVTVQWYKLLLVCVAFAETVRNTSPAELGVQLCLLRVDSDVTILSTQYLPMACGGLIGSECVNLKTRNDIDSHVVITGLVTGVP